MKKLWFYCLLSFSWSCFSYSNIPAEGEWISPSSFPYEFELTTDSSAMLIKVEQYGYDLVLKIGDSVLSNSPLNRAGPEFGIIQKNSRTIVSISPAHLGQASGSFKVEVRRLQTQEAHFFEQLAKANQLFALQTEDAVNQACGQYLELQQNIVESTNYTRLLSQFTIACHLKAGINIPETVLDSLSSTGSSLYPSYLQDWLLGQHYYYLDDYRQAQPYYERALASAINIETKSRYENVAVTLDIADLMSDLGSNEMMLAWELGIDQRSDILLNAELHLNSAIESAEKLGDKGILGKAYGSRAGYNYVIGNSNGVIENLLLSRATLLQAGSATALLDTLGNIGDYYMDWGNTKKAQQAYYDAVDTIERSSVSGNHEDTYQNLGRLYYDLGDFSRAKEATETGITYSVKAGQEWRSNTLYLQLAMIMLEQGDLEGAKTYRSLAYDYFQNEGWTPFRIIAQAALSEIEGLLGNQQRAIVLSTEVIDHLRSHDIKAGISLPRIYSNHAILLSSTNTTDAINFLESMIGEQSNLARITNKPADKILLYATLMNLFQNEGLLTQAMEAAELAFSQIESQRSEFDTMRLGAYWSGKTNEVYVNHAEFLLANSPNEHLERIFNTIERSRAASLRLRRFEILNYKISTDADAELEWRNIVSQLQENVTDGSEDQILQLDRELSLSAEKLFAASGSKIEYGELDLLSAEEVQENLDARFQLIQFVSSAKSTWRIDISRTSINIVNLGSTQLINALRDAAELEISNPSNSAISNNQLLSEQLLNNFSLNESTETLLVSASPNLDQVPFGTLIFNNDYVINSASVINIPSISEFFTPKIAAPLADPNRLELAVIADPAFTRSLSAEFGNEEQMRNWTSELQRLPYSAQEAKDLQNLFEDKNHMLLTDTNATQGNFFQQQVRDAKIIHIATHGYFNDLQPELVGFAMAADEFDESGFISLAEISAQTFNSELVVISACSTANGRIIAGEGSMSLTRAFLAQGVDTVVSTLWPISDAATAIFMREFYSSLTNGNDANKALQHAQLQLQKNPRYRNPFYWGAYIVTTTQNSKLL